MGQVAVTVNGQIYHIACDDGQEEHLRKLALFVDGRVGELAAAVGQVGDRQLLVMTGLLLADELSELRRQLTEVQSRASDTATRVGENVLAGEIEDLATRIEAVAQRLERI